MNLKERNHADDHMIVGSLKILGKVEGGGITEIRRDVDLIQQQAEQIAKQQNQYWRDLSSDGIISPVEKQMLLKEWHNIQYSESAIYTQAIALGYDDSNPIIQTYLAAYNALYEYLYETLKLFNQMQEDTRIDSRETFDGMFNNYYYAESFVLIALSKGILDTINIRSLESLSEPGNEGEIGLYKGGIYQYVSGTWVSVSTGNYKGARNSFPAAVDDDFFLVSEDFTVTEGLYVNGEQLIVNNDELVITVKYKKGFIYYCKDSLWYCEYDKTNYRYVAAFADVLNVTGDLPEIFNVRLQELEEQIEEVAALSHVPKYLGVSSSLPQNPGEGDYFVYSGTTTGNFWRRSDIYRYDNGNWAHLDPSLSENNSYYMSALEDILSLNETNSGYFSAIFTLSLFSNNAVIEQLDTREVTLKRNGAIRSEIYTSRRNGFCITADGKADFNGTTHIGGNCLIDGSTTIKGSCIIQKGVTFNGDIDSGPLLLSSQAQPGLVYLEYQGGTIRGWEIIERMMQDDVPKIYMKDSEKGIDGFYPYGVLINIPALGLNIEGGFAWSDTTYRAQAGYIYVLQSASTESIAATLLIMPAYTGVNLPYYIKVSSWVKSDTKTMLIRDLPNSPPATPGSVYAFSDGILRVVR